MSLVYLMTESFALRTSNFIVPVDMHVHEQRNRMYLLNGYKDQLYTPVSSL